MLSVTPLSLNDEQKSKLVQKICTEVSDALSSRSEMEKQWKTAVRQYSGRLQREGTAPPQANIDIPITREYSQQSASRLLNPFNQQDIDYVCIPRKPEFTDLAREFEEVLDFISDNADLAMLREQLVKASHIFSYTVAKVPWVVKTRKIKEYVKVQRPVMQPFIGMDGNPMMGQDGQPMMQPGMQEGQGADGLPVIQPMMETVLEEREVEVEDEVGAIPEVVPSEDFIFPGNPRNVDAARWVVHRLWLDELEQRRRFKAGEYEGDIKDIRAEKPTRPDFAIEERKLLGLDMSDDKASEYLELYTTLGQVRIWLAENTAFSSSLTDQSEIEPDYDDSCEIILTVDRTKRQFRRGIHNFLHAYPRPFATWSYEGRKDGIIGISLAYIMQPIHQLYSALVCQEADAQSAANENIVFGRVGSDTGKVFKNGRLRGGYYEINGDPKQDLTLFSVSQPRTSSPQLRSELQMHAERVAALSAINFGQDPTQRPTATGQTIQTNEAAQPLFSVLESFRAVLAKIAYMMLARYKQFYPEGMPFYLREETPDGMTTIPGQIHWPDGPIEAKLFIETKVSSGTMNKNMRRQEKLAMVDKIPQVYMTLSQMVAQAVQPSPMSPVMAKLVNAYQLVLDDWLTEFEIAKKDQINPDLTQEVNIGQQIQQLLGQMQQMAQQLQQSQGQNQQLSAELGGLKSAISGGPPAGPGLPGPPPPIPGNGGPPPSPPGPPGPGPIGPPPGGPPGFQG